MSGFNAKRARAKRPCPLWVDAFQRDTQHLQADEVGAYMLILMAMWTRESCDFPDDDSRLARVSRVSTRLWKSRIGPVIREFLEVVDGAVISQRLRKEATYVERTVKQQSDRKTGEKPDKSLKDNEGGETADTTVDQPRMHPTQQPNNPTYLDDDDSAGEVLSLRERVLVAAGHDASGVTANGKIVGSAADFQAFSKAVSDLSLDDDTAVALVGEAAGRKRDGPATSLKYFIPPLQQFAGARDAPAVVPAAGHQRQGVGYTMPKVNFDEIYRTNPELKQ